MARLKIPNIEMALKLYYGDTSAIELRNSDIMKLFDCSKSTANRLKALVIEEQKRLGKNTVSNSSVNTKIAYEVWHIDISEIEKRYLRGKRIWKEG